jgi:hypothetical protein
MSAHYPVATHRVEMIKLFAMRIFRSEKTPGRRTRSAAARLCGAIAIALAITISIAGPVAATLINLTQSNQAVAPSTADLRHLSKYFTPPYRPGPLPPEVNEILMRSAPPELHRACAAMVDSWGANARGTARVTIRILTVAGGNAWVAYRCDSRLPQYDNEYSERLATFSAKRGAIQFIDLAAPDDSRAMLYHVALANTLKLLGAENSAAFEVFAVNSSPRTSDANQTTRDRVSENRYVIIANSAAATKIALSLVTMRVRPGAAPRAPAGSGDDDNVASQAGLRFGHDLAGHLTAVNVYNHDRSPGTESHYALTHYEWSRATLTFEVAAPVTLPPVPMSRQMHRRPLAN